jgi:ribonucleotide reductase beta subunit family protein with ferritin-like domain
MTASMTTAMAATKTATATASNEESLHQESFSAIESSLAQLQPLKNLAKNWDIDIASWCVP